MNLAEYVPTLTLSCSYIGPKHAHVTKVYQLVEPHELNMLDAIKEMIELTNTKIKDDEEDIKKNPLPPSYSRYYYSSSSAQQISISLKMPDVEGYHAYKATTYSVTLNKHTDGTLNLPTRPYINIAVDGKSRRRVLRKITAADIIKSSYEKCLIQIEGIKRRQETKLKRMIAEQQSELIRQTNYYNSVMDSMRSYTEALKISMPDSSDEAEELGEEPNESILTSSEVQETEHSSI